MMQRPKLAGRQAGRVVEAVAAERVDVVVTDRGERVSAASSAATSGLALAR